MEAVVQLAKAIAEGENIFDYEQAYNDAKAEAVKNSRKAPSVELLAATACNVALDSNVDMFVCLTENGRIAKFVSKYRPI